MIILEKIQGVRIHDFIETSDFDFFFFFNKFQLLEGTFIEEKMQVDFSYDIRMH